jgi:hypothetical protein
MVEAQTHRRFLKTHLPLDALVFSPKAKYIYIGRDGRDVVWSMYNHHANANHSGTRRSTRRPGASFPGLRAEGILRSSAHGKGRGPTFGPRSFPWPLSSEDRPLRYCATTAFGAENSEVFASTAFVAVAVILYPGGTA